MSVAAEHKCLDPDQALALVDGELPPERVWEVLSDVERCSDCELLLGEAGRALRDSLDSGWAAPPQRGAQELVPGAIVADRYRIDRVIGRGGMGIVHEAYDTELNESVALKTIRADGRGQIGAVGRLKRELRLARRVVHPNVCRVLEFGRHEGEVGPIYFFTMEHLLGEPLDGLLRRRGRFGIRDVLSLGRELASGLAAIHASGILHRDVKTSNIVVRAAKPPRRPVLVDFGIAHAPDYDDGLPVPATIAGTPNYMAPEQASRGEVGPEADVYSLGVVLFELLTGCLPSRSRSALPEGPAPVSIAAELKRRPGMPDALVELIGDCLAMDPMRRPRNGGEVARRLDAVPSCEGSIRLAAPHTGPAGLTVASSLLVGALVLTMRLDSSPEARVKVARVDTPAVHVLERPLARSAEGSPARDRVLPHRPPSIAIEPEQDGLPRIPPVDTSRQRPSPAKAGGRAVNESRQGSQHGQSDVLERPSTPTPEPSDVVMLVEQAANCSPPYFYDARGVRVFRKRCLE